MEYVALKSSSNSLSASEEEFSDDDDDHNHKHRRQQVQSEPLNADAFQQHVTMLSEKVHEPFESGKLFPEKKNIASKFERSAGLSVSESVPPVPFDLNQRVNQTSFGDLGPVRGNGRNPSPYGQYISMSASADFFPHMVNQGYIHLIGKVLPGIPNPRAATMDAYGALNGGFDNLSLLVYPGAFRPPMSSSLSLGFPRQCCRDFEEQGYCLQGDMCPMEHGTNRIVVKDIQSLSQFNLPVSIPSTILPGASAVTGPLPPANVSLLRLINDKEPHSKSKGGIATDALIWNHKYPHSTNGGEADVYDPDQPLWNNFDPGNPSTIFALPSKFDEAETMIDDVVHRLRESNEVDTNNQLNGPSLANLSYLRRVGISRSAGKEKSQLGSSMCRTRNETNSEAPLIIARSQGTSISLKTQDDVTGACKPTQKAERSVFVSGIPPQSNNSQSLLFHFRKFGEVIDIYIPGNSQQAFVQFSRREEAEAALRAPDAVLGNRFIKLSWANRDRIQENGTSSGNSAHMSHGQKSGLVPSNTGVCNGGKDNFQYAAAAKAGNIQDIHISSSIHPGKTKPRPKNGPRVLPPIHKKPAIAEQLKEELRKKQAMLEQKKKDFKRQLEKLEKQAAGSNCDVAAQESAKRRKLVSACELTKMADVGPSNTGSSRGSSCNIANIVTTPLAKLMDSRKESGDNAGNPPKTNSIITLQKSFSSKQLYSPTAPLSTSFVASRYKLDSRTAAFRIIPPIPCGLANVAALKEHFLLYGELSNVEFRIAKANEGSSESQASRNCSAHVRFSTRQSAEKAFTHGRCWKGHYMQFLWLESDDSTSVTKEAFENDKPSAGKEASISSGKPTVPGVGKSKPTESKLFGSNSKTDKGC